MPGASNIKKLNWFRFLKWGKLVIVVEALFFIAGGLTFADYLYLITVFSILVYILEIPSGAFSDLFGRKNTLVLAQVFELLQIFVYIFSYSFTTFLISRIFAAISMSLYSGADSALLYDSAQSAKKDFKKVNSDYHFMSHLGMAIFFPIGAFLFSLQPKLPAILSIPSILGCLIITTKLTPMQKAKGKMTFATHLNHMKESVRFAYSHRYIRFIITYLIPLSIAIAYCHFASSLYLERVEIPTALIGVIGAVSSFIGAFVIKQSYSIESRLGEKISLFIIPPFVLATLYFHSFLIPFIGVVFLFMIRVFEGYTLITTDAYLHSHIKSSHRATVMSVKNQMNMFIPGLYTLLAGYMSEQIGFAQTYSFTAGFLFIPIVLILIYTYSIYRNTENSSAKGTDF